MILAAVASQLELSRDARPLGTPADLEQLRERSDLNLLFVLIDTLRADRLSSYGYARETSPAIDELARTGIRFAQQQSQSSWTKCSMASLWTGLYPVRTGVTRAPEAVSPDARMPAEILRDAGYRTYAIWRNGWIGPVAGGGSDGGAASAGGGAGSAAGVGMGVGSKRVAGGGPRSSAGAAAGGVAGVVEGVAAGAAPGWVAGRGPDGRDSPAGPIVASAISASTRSSVPTSGA